MNTFQKSLAAFGLAALAFGTLAAVPANAQVFHHLRQGQMRKAASLDRKAVQAAVHGNYRLARHLRSHAAHLRGAARHGF